MPRHTFQFPPHIRKAVKAHVVRAYSKVDARRYEQESPYIAALAVSLEGIAYEERDGFVGFKSTVFNDRGSNSAEKKFGADLAITADVGNSNQRISKAILIQAKRGEILELSTKGMEDLHGQIAKMKEITRSPKVMELREVTGGLRIPRIISGNLLFAEETYSPQTLETYFTSRVLTTLDGDTRQSFVKAVQRSDLTQVEVIARVD